MTIERVNRTRERLPVLNRAEVRAAELAYSRSQKKPTYELMRRAGMAAWTVIAHHWPEARQLIVLCGRGNNGGDGFEVARLAKEAGCEVEVQVMGGEPLTWRNTVTGDAAIAMKAWERGGGRLQCFDRTRLGRADLLVDAILGSGIREPAREDFVKAIDAVNASGTAVLSLDVPSGLDCNRGIPVGSVVRAERTLTFIALKQGLVTADGCHYTGTLLLDRLQLSGTEVLQQYPRYLVSLESCRNLLQVRAANSHKGDFGRVVVIGGQRGLGGAAIMAAQAASRVGAGSVCLYTDPAHVAAALARQPEIMTLGLGSMLTEQAAKMMASASAIVVGPGLGQSEWSVFWLEQALAAGKPCVVDADALLLAVQRGMSLEQAVITPHPGEAATLLKCSAQTIQRDRWRFAAELQQKTAAVAVLKGAGTLIQTATDVRVCPYGNPGMASAGMGDILAGTIGGLLAQGLSRDDAATLGVLIHSRAGDLAGAGQPRGLLATDLLPFIRQLVNLEHHHC